MIEPLDADLLKDLRGLDKPPAIDGNDAEFQDFRVRLRIRMSLVSQTLIDKRETERNDIALAAMKASGEAPSERCIQRNNSLVWIGTRCVPTHVCSVEESQRAQAWRLTRSRHASNTRNHQHVLVQKIMKSVKPRCGQKFQIELESMGTGRRRMGKYRKKCMS